jgi:hypothetical protein
MKKKPIPQGTITVRPSVSISLVGGGSMEIVYPAFSIPGWPKPEPKKKPPKRRRAG